MVDVDSLAFVAKAKRATQLRDDPDMRLSVTPSCSAAGHAWLSTLSHEEAIERFARKRGFSIIVEVFALAMSAMAAPVAGPGAQTIGVVIIAGPPGRRCG